MNFPSDTIIIECRTYGICPATYNLQQNPTAFSLQLAAKLNNLLPSVASITIALTLI
jgi:hypothetical protein